ncbi:MAG TPA: phosphate uptake regulator PhoU, partial [Candidatus Bathyarchaeota archaeon]|nr:phosphate uptake regulator PhoU [Candidatus Bathyarchaeota archaeon]
MKDPSQLRRIQLTGGSTYVVSLPKNWAKAAGIKPGDYVQLIPQPD